MGVANDETLLNLLESANPREIFFDWDNYAKDPKNINPNNINDAGKFIHDKFESFDQFNNLNDIIQESKQQLGIYRDKFVEILPINVSKDDTEELYCLFIINKKQQGKVSTEMLKKYKIKGKLIAEILNGKPHTLENGQVINAQDITSGDTPGPATLILDLPQIDNFYKLANNDLLKNLLGNGGLNSHIGTDYFLSYIIHTGPTSVIKNQDYMDWMSNFPSNVNQIFTNEDMEEIIVEDTIPNYDMKTKKGSEQTIPSRNFRFETYLGSLHKNFAPFFPSNTVHSDQILNEKQETESNIFRDNLYKMQSKIGYSRRFQEYTIYPLEKAGIVKDILDASKVGAKIDNLVGFNDAYTNVMSIYNKMVKDPQFNFEDDPEVTVFGTGSMMPGTYRNVSALNLKLSDKHNIILDCGEGTFSQITKHYPTEYSLDNY